MRRTSFCRVGVAVALTLVGLTVAVGPAEAIPAKVALSWGWDGYGQLGYGESFDGWSLPEEVAVAGGGLVAVSAGFGHSLVLRADGSVLAFGNDGGGQLGDGGGDLNQPLPVAVSGLGPGSGVVAVAAGGTHSLALKADGTVLAWGQDVVGQVGDGGAAANQPVPVVVSGLGPGSGVVSIAAGVAHSLALRADGSVLAWGFDGSGQLGDGGANTDKHVPVLVLGPGSGVVAVSAGGLHSLALLGSGTPLAWGSNSRGQLGTGTTPYGATVDHPTPNAAGLGGSGGIVAVSAGFEHSLILKSDGAVLATGNGTFGQLGTGAFGSGSDQASPVAVSGLGRDSGVVAISAGGAHNLALRWDGTVLGWGNNEYGQLGTSPTSAQPRPERVGGLEPGSGVTGVAAGAAHSLAVTGPPVLPSTFAPVSPARVWDTRSGPGPLGRIGPGAVRNVAVTGIGGVPSTGVTSVVLNVTVVNPTAATYVTVWPTGEGNPIASNLNVPRGDTRPNLVTVKVGAGGKVSLLNAAGTVDVVADVAGWYGPAGGERFTPLSPTRVWDTRAGSGPSGRLGAGVTRHVQVTGVGGVPATGVTAVVLNVTAVRPTAGTFVTAWPAGEPRPLASNLNVPAGDTRANVVVVKVGAGGYASFSSSAGTIDLVADVAGYYGAAGSGFTSISAVRVQDTRFPGGPPPGRVTGAAIAKVVGAGGVPTTGVTAVVLNVTAVGATATTYLTAWPDGEAKPLASNLNVAAGDTRANLVVVKVGANGIINFSNAAGRLDLIVDVAGWFGPPGA